MILGYIGIIVFAVQRSAAATIPIVLAFFLGLAAVICGAAGLRRSIHTGGRKNVAGIVLSAIGISGHSLGVVPVDDDGRLLRETVPIWSDSRASAEAAGFGADDAWYLKTGCGFPPI